MALLKRIARKLLEQPMGNSIRTLIDLREFRKARRLTSESEQNFGWRALALKDISAIRHEKRSDTLYILGSGTSINQLRDETWESIALGVSIGINHWTLHQFVPDIYAVETIPDWRRGEGASTTALEIDHTNHLQLLGRPEVLDSKTIIIAMAPRSEWENLQLLEIPTPLRSRTFIYSRVTPFTRHLPNLSGDISRGLIASECRPSRFVVPDSGATLARMISLGILAGFRRIVLLGIDLSTTYFWQESGSRIIDPRLAQFEQSMTGGVHETMLRVHRPFSIVETLAALQTISAERGVILTSMGCHKDLFHSGQSDASRASARSVEE